MAEQLVFVSYSRSDEQFVLELAGLLRARGAHVWLDQESIPKGKDWDLAIEEALRRASHLIAILSPRSVASPEVRSEIRIALDEKKTVVPVLYRPCEIPRRLRLIEHVDMTTVSNPGPEAIDRLMAALRRQDGAGHSATLGPFDVSAPTPPALTPPAPTPPATRQTTLIARLRSLAAKHVVVVAALVLPLLGLITAHVFRLPVWVDHTPIYIVGATVMLALLLFWIGNRAVAAVISFSAGLALILKPLIVPIEGFVNGETFPFDSATARDYWLPGTVGILVAIGIVLISSASRLIADLRSLRVTWVVLVALLPSGLAGARYVSRPTYYDVYRPFRAPYGNLRERLRMAAAKIAHTRGPLPLAAALTIPLVIDERRDTTRSEDPAATAHLILYQHLLAPDSYVGEIEYSFNGDLHLNVRDTGPDPVLSVMGEFAREPEQLRRNLQQVLDAPYLVSIRPLGLPSRARLDQADIARGSPYSVAIFDLPRDSVIYEKSVDFRGDSFADLKSMINATISETGAKVTTD